jgi:hypothetical protein
MLRNTSVMPLQRHHHQGGKLASYDFPRLFVARWVASMLLMQPRVLYADATTLLRGRNIAVRGVDRLPAEAPFILAMNHYERAGLGVWWPAFLVTLAIGGSRPGHTVVWLITNRFYRFRLRGTRLPDRMVSWFLARVAARYGLILVARPQAAAMGRAIALRRARRMLEARAPRVVASTPEGDHATGVKLTEPVPTSGTALAWLARGGVPIVPAGVYEDADGTLVAQFGHPFMLPWPGLRDARRMRQTFADNVMRAIAGCLPEANRGPYADGAPSDRLPS